VVRSPSSALQLEATDPQARDLWLAGLRLAAEVLREQQVPSFSSASAPAGSGGTATSGVSSPSSDVAGQESAARAAEARLREAERKEADFLARQEYVRVVV
jgi:hypothetical protein